MRLIKYLMKKMSIMIIREARHTVFRLRIPYFLLYTLGIGIIAFTIYTFTISSLHSETYVRLMNYKSKYEAAAEELQEVTLAKTQVIDDLQNEIIQLSNQSQLMKSKIEEMIKNEQYLRSIVMNEEPADSKTKYTNEIDINALPTDSTLGIGGAIIPVSTEEIVNLANNTEQLYEDLFMQVDELTANLNQSIEDAEQKIRMWAVTPTIYPSYNWRVTSRFGYRADPFTGRTSFHSGIDFGGDYGDSVFSTADGVIVSAASDLSHGRNIIVQHYPGMRTWYMHLSKIIVNVGDKVTKGQVIGYIGSTGRSTGPHLHYEVLKNGVAVNPAPYIQTSREEAINVRKEKEIRP